MTNTQYKFFSIRLTQNEYDQFENLAHVDHRTKANLFRRWLAIAHALHVGQLTPAEAIQRLTTPAIRQPITQPANTLIDTQVQYAIEES